MDRNVELYYGKNGTVELVSQDTPPPVFSFFITVFCFLCGVSHNLIVSSAVFSDEKLRSSSFHRMSALVSLTCLLDCLTNESVAVGLLLNNVISWCALSAVLFPLFLLLHAAALALFCLERAFTLYKVPLPVGACVLAALSAWLFGLLCSLPLLAASDVYHFRNRNSCGTVQHNCWSAALYLLGLLLCWTCQGVYFLVAVRSIRQRQHLEPQATFSPLPASTMSWRRDSSTARTLDHVTRTCSSVLLLYLVLVVPQTLSVAVTLFLRLDLEPDPWLPPDSDSRSASTADLELLLTYLRYMYNVAVPAVVLSSDPAVRRQARRVFCCSANSVSSDDSVLASLPAVSPDTELKPVKRPGFKTPVLFSTPQGIHLRMAHHGTSTGDSIRLITQFCDLTDGPEYTFSSRDGDSGEDCRRRSEERRNVRFSSKVEAISLTGITAASGSTSDHQVPGYSDTRTVLNPLLVVRGDVHRTAETDRTYSKF